MGNFSRDTFKLTNILYQLLTGEKVDKPQHYTCARIQQGVPLVDADWNELEDIERYERRAFIKWMVGDGVPKGSEGFFITNLKADDFAISQGICFVSGWDVISISDTTYKKQPLYNNNELSNEWGVDPLLPINMAVNKYVVYLDVWEREVGYQEDDRIKNEAIGIETCVRFKREWVVRVVEGDKAPDAKLGHAHYSLASVKNSAPTDLRRTGLAVLSKEINIKDGRVGIGTTMPAFCKLEIDTRDLDQPALRLTGSGGAWGSALELNDTAPIKGKKYSIASKGGFLMITDHKVGESRIIIDEDGNVGIGTHNIDRKLTVNGEIQLRSPKVDGIYGFEFDRTDEDNRTHTWKLWHMSKKVDVNPPQYYNKNAFEIWEYKTDRYSKLCGEADPADGPMCDPRFVILEGGNVGIGTHNPLFKLHVKNVGNFGDEDATGVAQPGLVPLVVQGAGTIFGALNQYGRPAFAINLSGTGGGAIPDANTARGQVRFYDRFDGNWNNSIVLQNGRVGIGMDPQDNYILSISGSALASGGQWQPSDMKYKKNISHIKNALAGILAIRGIAYEWKIDEYKEKGFSPGKYLGVIAQEIEEIFPEAVGEGPDGEKVVCYTSFIPIIIEALKEQHKMIIRLNK